MNELDSSSVVVKSRPSIDEMVGDITTAFEECKVLDGVAGSGGAQRSCKGKAWEKFFAPCILYAADKRGHAYVCDKRTIVTDGGSCRPDIVLWDGDTLVIHGESKDYADATMYKSIVINHGLLRSKYPEVMTISLSGQNAAKTAKCTQARLNKASGFDDGSICSDALLDSIRNPKKKLYLLDHTHQFLVDATNRLIDRISKVIR